MTPMPWQLRGGVEIMRDRLHDTRGTKSRDYLETIGDKNFGKLKGIRQIRQSIYRQSFLLYGMLHPLFYMKCSILLSCTTVSNDS